MKEQRKLQLIKGVNQLLDKKSLLRVKQSAAITYLPGGSDRFFFRLIDKGSLIIMVTPTKKEVREYICIQKHLLKRGVGVPEIYAWDKDAKMVIMEDVGKESVYKIMNRNKGKKTTEQLYKTIIENLILLQVKGNTGIERCKPVYKRVFDYNVLRWESEYFRDAFLENQCGFSKQETKALENDFHKLALSLAHEPTFFMHRDLQSTNIFFKNGFVKFIDFQSAHRGLLTYDIASLLRDSYINLRRKMRESLLVYYHMLLQEYVDDYRSFRAFRRIYIVTAIQRNMQVLGAFSFLSKTKKKKWFLNAIPQGIEYLREGLDEIGVYRDLRKFVNSSRVKECVKLIDSLKKK